MKAQTIYKHRSTGEHYVPVKGAGRLAPPDAEGVNRILVHPVFGDRTVWLPEDRVDQELVQDLTVRKVNARRVFWTSVALTFMTAIPVQWYLIQHSVPSWGAAAIAVFAGSGATDIVFRALKIPTR